MSDKEAIKKLKQMISLNQFIIINQPTDVKGNKDLNDEIKAMNYVLNLIEKQKAEIEKKDKIQKEVAEEIDNVAVELSKLTDNIFIINQAMKLQKIAKEKLGKFYID